MTHYRNILTVIAIGINTVVLSQVPLSIGTDIGAARSFKAGQEYWALAHDINFQFHLSGKNSAFAWLTYTIPGKFREDLLAVAKSPVTLPVEVPFKNRAQVNFTEIALGWKHYWKGNYATEEGWNGYSLAGLGLLMGRVNNTFDQRIDTSAYAVPVRHGSGHFKRLTLDLGLGLEFPAGGDVFLYGEGKAFVPLTNYPSPYLLNNDYTPLLGIVSFGIRVLFN